MEALRDSLDGLSGPAKDLTGTEIENLSNDNAGIIPALIVGYNGPGKNMQGLVALLEKGDTGSPDWHYIELTRKCSPINYVHADAPPICLFHGGHDSVVPLSQSEKLYKALLAAGADHLYFLLLRRPRPIPG